MDLTVVRRSISIQQFFIVALLNFMATFLYYFRQCGTFCVPGRPTGFYGASSISTEMDYASARFALYIIDLYEQVKCA